jgi:hypothetical protein
MDSKTDESRPWRPRRRPLLIAVATGAVAVGTVAAVATYNTTAGTSAPVELGSQPAANQAPAPRPAEQPAPAQHPPAASAAPGQPHAKATDECFGTTPKPGSSPARPLCDWDRIFADTDARARALRQQQTDQLNGRANELKQPTTGHQ